MEDDFWLCFAKCQVDLVPICDVNVVILDMRVSIGCGLDIKNGHLWRGIKFEEPFDYSMTKKAAASNHEG